MRIRIGLYKFTSTLLDFFRTLGIALSTSKRALPANLREDPAKDKTSEQLFFALKEIVKAVHTNYVKKGLNEQIFNIT